MVGISISLTCATDPRFSTTYTCNRVYTRSSGGGWFRPQRHCKNSVRKNRLVPACVSNDGSTAENDTWLKSATPYEILGLSNDSNVEEVKTAFREKVKIYHPDVYKGDGDSQDMMLRLIRAYEMQYQYAICDMTPGTIQKCDMLCNPIYFTLQILVDNSSSNGYLRRKSSSDPFAEPEGPVTSIFVNELRCRGPSCSESCVTKCPQTFHFSNITNRARANGTGEDEYDIFLAVGQCPERCIHYVTADQKSILEEQLHRCIDGADSMNSIATILESFLARANFENGRSRGPLRKAMTSDKWVDWF